ncbi:MAG: lysoplasmalogenase [Candidatus Thorarchaeota archaeon]|jgi:uncharacterized membrane protein YhhN
MSLVIFTALFWIIAIVSIILQDKASTGEKKVASLTTVIKLLPALTAAVFVIIFRTPTLFTILLTVALVFSMLGDVGMEVDLVPGIGMFLIGHIFYTATFLWQATTVSLLTIPVSIAGICMILMVVYVVVLIRRLQASGPEVPPFILKAGTFYFLLISATLSSSILLWLSTNSLLGFVPVLGALFFVISDSLIGINEFHNKIPRHELFIMSTYYLAIFLLSLSVLVYAF